MLLNYLNRFKDFKTYSRHSPEKKDEKVCAWDVLYRARSMDYI